MRKRRSQRPSFLPDDTTPMIRENASSKILASIFWLAAFPAAAFVLIWLYGFPGLLLEYQYVGPKDYRTDLSCLHFTVRGWVRTEPPILARRCPIVRLFPIF